MAVTGEYGGKVGQMWSDLVEIDTTPRLLAIHEHRMRNGRMAVEVFVPEGTTAYVYLGGKDLEPKKGIPVPAGSGRIIPVNNTSHAAEIYICADQKTKVVIAEYTQ